MKVLLLQDIKNVGKKNEIKNVADGFALNNLLPRKLAVIATPLILRNHEAKIQDQTKKHLLELKNIQEKFSSFEGSQFKIKGKANLKGHLFASINALEISKQLHEDHKVSLNPLWIKMDHPIKTLGVHTVNLSHEGIKGILTLLVISE